MRNIYRNIALGYIILMTILLYFLESLPYQIIATLILTAIFIVLSIAELFKMLKTREQDPATITVILLLI